MNWFLMLSFSVKARMGTEILQRDKMVRQGLGMGKFTRRELNATDNVTSIIES